MQFLNQFVISFTGLKEGDHEYKYELEDEFFEHFEYNDFNSCSISATVVLSKKSNLLEFNFYSKGKINLNCHVSNEPFDYVQEHEMKLVVKFSSELSDDNEELLVLPVGQTQINVGKYLFEMIVLSLPIKIIHPGVSDGSLETETLKRLREYELNVLDKKDIKDPRWDKLKDLI